MAVLISPCISSIFPFKSHGCLFCFQGHYPLHGCPHLALHIVHLSFQIPWLSFLFPRPLSSPWLSSSRLAYRPSFLSNPMVVFSVSKAIILSMAVLISPCISSIFPFKSHGCL